MEPENNESTGIGKKRMKLILGFGLVGTTGIAILVGFVFYFFASQSPAQTPPPSPSTLPVVNTISVIGYELVSEKRISRTISKYTYRVSVRNDGPSLIVVSGTASSPSTAVTFTDNAVTLGDIASNTPAVSSDTFTIRQDRTRSLSTNDITWEFRAAPGEGISPDPGPENDLTIEGIDSNNDGVRDDVERYIAVQYPDSERTRAALMQLARNRQSALLNAGSKSLSIDNARVLDTALACLGYVQPDEYGDIAESVIPEIVDTEERLAAYVTYSSHLHGELFFAIPQDERRQSCTFDPDAMED